MGSVWYRIERMQPGLGSARVLACEFLTCFNKIGVAWKPWGRGVARDG
jgi:hypothetical protein